MTPFNLPTNPNTTTSNFFNLSDDDVTFFPLDGVQPRGDRVVDLMTEDQYYTVLKSTLVIRFVISVGGILGNVVNIRTFLRMGLEDSVTIAFFNLAISDLHILLAEFLTVITKLCQILERDFGIFFEMRPFFIVVLCNAVGRIFSDVTVLVTTYLAVQRCLCVVIPLHFKGVFTRCRTFTVMVVIWAYCLACGVMMLSQYEIRKHANSSSYVMSAKPTQPYILRYINIINGLIMTISCQVIVLACFSIMRHALKKSVKFRQATSSSSACAANVQQAPRKDSKDSRAVATDVGEAKARGKDGGEAASSSSKIGITSSKERQAILQVSIVSAIFLVTSAPYIITAIATLVVPELNLYGKYHYTFVSVINIRVMMEIVNSAVNFFVYYKYNTKFRSLVFRRNDVKRKK